MRVRISYAVDSKELPSEAFRLIRRASMHAESIKSAVVDTEIDIEEEGLRPSQIDAILNVRDEMVKLDAYLADIAQIILGDQQIKLQGSSARGGLGPSQTNEAPVETAGEYGELLERTGEISQSIAEFAEDFSDEGTDE